MTNFILWINGTLSLHEVVVKLSFCCLTHTKTEAKKLRRREKSWHRFITKLRLRNYEAQVEATMTMPVQARFYKFLDGEFWFVNFVNLINFLPAQNCFRLVIEFWTKPFRNSKWRFLLIGRRLKLFLFFMTGGLQGKWERDMKRAADTQKSSWKCY